MTQEQYLHDIYKDVTNLYTALNGVLVGQEQIIRDVIIALFAGGHILIEGMPGLGKTLLAKAISKALGTKLARIQCTPDLSPSDITGTEILISTNTSESYLKFVKGPIFSSIILVDEINRATPKTQSALLEAMQEQQVTYAGTAYPLPQPFIVIATQNPIELEGTYPLPEAQLDRFFSKTLIDLPDVHAWRSISNEILDHDPINNISPILTLDGYLKNLIKIQEIIIADQIREAAVKLIMSTHPRHNRHAMKHIRYGSSPRGLQAILRAARVNAVIEKRANVSVEDIFSVALPVLRHRIILSLESELENITPDDVLNELLAEWKSNL